MDSGATAICRGTYDFFYAGGRYIKIVRLGRPLYMNICIYIYISLRRIYDDVLFRAPTT